MKTPIQLFLAFLCVSAAAPKAQAVSPAADGCYLGFTTAEGCNALAALTSGAGDTGLGWYSLHSVSTGSYNTGVGAGTLMLNTGDSNTAVGTGALLLNTTGSQNTAVGTDALVYNDSGTGDTAIGFQALEHDTAGTNTATGTSALAYNSFGSYNVANGALALYYNQYAGYNTAVGYSALYYNDRMGSGNAENNCAFGSYALWSNDYGSSNSAFGFSTLESNDSGFDNTAIGDSALLGNIDGSSNVAVGAGSLVVNVNGSYNTAIGDNAGAKITGNGNVCIGYAMAGISGQDNRTWISNVYADMATTRIVYVDSDGHFGTLSSSRRYKEDIKSMDDASESLYALKPVTFHYKKNIDPSQALSFGLIAEEVAEASPELIIRDEQGRPQTVRYDAVNAMLLNEFLKEHKGFVEEQRKVQAQGATIARLEKQIEALTRGLQKVSAQLELSKPTPQTVLNNQ